MPRQYDALIFDCDGVLLNSEQICQETELVFLSSLGIDYAKPEYIDKYMGTTEREFREQLRTDALSRFAVELPPAFFAELSAAISAAYRERLAPIPDAPAAIAAWGKRKAVASSSEPRNLLFKLRGKSAPIVIDAPAAAAAPAGSPADADRRRSA